MTQYIPKDVLLAEIEKMRNQEVQWMERQGYTNYHQGLRDGYNRILSLLDTLDVKEMEEVDLVKEYDNFIIDLALSRLVNRNAGIVIAKHFYELGLKTQGEEV